MLHPRTIGLVFCLLISLPVFATTWDEPWQDSIIKRANYFVLAKVDSSNAKKGVSIEIIKSIAGEELKGKITITEFYLIHLCSRSGNEGPEFHFTSGREYYFFINKNDSGKYGIATPTSGFAARRDEDVVATYRHSYHQALVPIEVYEQTMTAIFNNYHNKPYDKKYINDYVSKYLSLKPAGFNENEVDTFFAQHVALECVYHLRLPGYYSKIVPFLDDTSNFHSEVSAAQALIAYNTAECKQELLKVISDTLRDNFLQVICVWTLSDFKPEEFKEKLVQIEKTASTEENGFGGDIMDPRVCTHFPTVKEALDKLIASL